MKKYFFIASIALLAFSFFATSCEDILGESCTCTSEGVSLPMKPSLYGLDSCEELSSELEMDCD